MIRVALLSGSYVFLNSTELLAQSKNNILVIVADDLGKDVLSVYNPPTKERANTPNIDLLAEQGIVFDNFWGYPLSSPVRAAMLTGRYGHHTSVVNLDVTLPVSEQTVFEALPSNYSNALFGKWHLSKDQNFASDYGIDYFAGIAMGGGVRDYYNWQLTQNGKTAVCTEYVTSKITDLAKDWIADQDSPWFCWVAYNAPHTPYHIPPKDTYTGKLKKSDDEIESNPLPYYLAMIENLDYEIGRLLESVDSNTTIIFVGDNGSDNKVLQAPYPLRHGKGSLYQPGISVPLVVCGGDNIKGGIRSDVAVNAVDIFPTIMELTGESMGAYEDGYSFLNSLSGGESQRRYTFSEINNMRSGYMNAISDGEYKIITTQGEITMFFNLSEDSLEQNNLLGSGLSSSDKEALTRLESALLEMDIPKIERAERSSRVGMGRRMQPREQGNNRPARFLQK